MNQKHALVASYGVPEGDRDSGSRRRLDLIEFLQDAGYKITFVAASPITNSHSADLLRRRGITVHEGMRTYGPMAAPEPVLDKLITRQAVDFALLAEWPVAALYLPVLRRLCPNTPVLIDSVDLHCLRYARRALTGRGDGVGLLDQEFAEQLTGELNVYAAADGVLTVSEKEAIWLADFCGGAVRPFYVPDCEDFQPSNSSFSDRRGILIVGNYQYLPNVDAVAFLCQQILPHIDKTKRLEHPLEVVGNGLDELVQEAIKETSHVRQIGWVPSLTPHFQNARISVIPLRYGAGTKRKVLQALSCGTPIVTTSIGAEGLNLVHEEHALIADDPKEFALATERLLSDEPLWRRLVENGGSLMRATHSREAARRQFLLAVEAVQKATVRREMLQEITAVEYFRWINYEYLDRLSSQIRLLLKTRVSTTAKMIVLSGGHERLLELDGRTAWHFPQIQDGRPTVDTPPDESEVLALLERLQRKGGDHFLIPFPQYWWLDQFAELRLFLEEHCRLIASKENVAKIFALDAFACEFINTSDVSRPSLWARLGSLHRLRRRSSR